MHDQRHTSSALMGLMMAACMHAPGIIPQHSAFASLLVHDARHCLSVMFCWTLQVVIPDIACLSQLAQFGSAISAGHRPVSPISDCCSYCLQSCSKSASPNLQYQHRTTTVQQACMRLGNSGRLLIRDPHIGPSVSMHCAGDMPLGRHCSKAAQRPSSRHVRGYLSDGGEGWGSA